MTEPQLELLEKEPVVPDCNLIRRAREAMTSGSLGLVGRRVPEVQRPYGASPSSNNLVKVAIRTVSPMIFDCLGIKIRLELRK